MGYVQNVDEEEARNVSRTLKVKNTYVRTLDKLAQGNRCGLIKTESDDLKRFLPNVGYRGSTVGSSGVAMVDKGRTGY